MPTMNKLNDTLRDWWHQKARMGMTASEMASSLERALAANDFVIAPRQMTDAMKGAAFLAINEDATEN